MEKTVSKKALKGFLRYKQRSEKPSSMSHEDIVNKAIYNEALQDVIDFVERLTDSKVENQIVEHYEKLGED